MAISKHDKKALADLFIHMGVPLVTAVQTVDSWSGGTADENSSKVQAEKLSKLLSISVDLATKITKKMEIRDAYTLENVRGKIIRIVTPIIAQNYVTNGDVPTDEELDTLTSLFDVLLSFADSVSPTDEKGSKPTKIAAMVEACEPLLEAIRKDNMGMDDKAMFNECVAGIKGRAEQLSMPLGVDDPIAEGLFKSIVTIFVSCYGKQDSLEGAWRECDERLALIYGLTSFVREKTGIVVADSPAPEASKKDTEKVDEKPKAASKDDDKPETKEEKDDDGSDDGEFNPMSFFS